MDINLTDKQKRFCEEYLVDFNATQAAIRAGYSKKTAKEVGCQNLTKLNIQNYISERKDAMTAKTEITVERVLAEYAKLAFFDPRKLFRDDGSPKAICDLDDETAGALAGLDVQETFEGEGNNKEFVGYTKKYKLANKQTALDSLAKYLKMFKEAPDEKTLDKARELLEGVESEF